ncbi:MAG: cbb3-type cytochrome c oxidase subunit 3 [Pseudomonadota bacterium]
MDIDINTLRAVMTVLSFAVFIGICWWALSSKRATAFEQAARLPLDDDFPLYSNKHTGAHHE